MTLAELAQILALATGVWGEARGESRTGKIAVAWVVKNRAEAQWRGKSTYAEVLTDPLQFSAYNTNDPNLKKMAMPWVHDFPGWLECLGVAFGVHQGTIPDPTHGSNHYHAKSVAPTWAAHLEQTNEIGNHVFFRG